MEEKDLMNVENVGSDKRQGLSIVVDDGRVAVPIKNTLGEEVGVFYFNPTDIGIIDRFKEASEKFKDVVEPLQDIEEGASDEEYMEALKQAKERLYVVCDELFGGNMSEAFFGKIEPFSPSDGVFYCETALNAVSDFVAQQFDKETEKINARISKYTRDYMKKSGKHKDGRK